jgi:predicted nucleic acid-binding protein
MSAARFLDTNVVVYAHDTAEPAKQVVAQQLITDTMRQGDGVISAQVLSEFFHTVAVRRKLMMASEALRIIEGLEAGLTILSVTPSLVKEAVATHQRYQLSYWDSLIVAAARDAGCTEIHSEDLSDGQDYGGVVVVNPFRSLKQVTI